MAAIAVGIAAFVFGKSPELVKCSTAVAITFIVVKGIEDVIHALKGNKK